MAGFGGTKAKANPIGKKMSAGTPKGVTGPASQGFKSPAISAGRKMSGCK
jgi:hypothetical protein